MASFEMSFEGSLLIALSLYTIIMALLGLAASRWFKTYIVMLVLALIWQFGNALVLIILANNFNISFVSIVLPCTVQ
jgi:hypothetical protein